QTDNCTPGKEYLITWNDQPLRGNRHRLRMSREGENRLDLYAVENGKKKLLNRRNITVYPKRKTELVLDDNVNSELPTYHFMVKNNDAVAAIWKFENGAVVRDLHAGFMFSSKGRHRVKLTTINEHGCMDSTEQLVYIKHAYNLMASSIFNPLREKWMPAGLQKNDLPFELKIVNQEGNVIFVSRDAGDVWDGKWAENRIAVPGEIYYWVASIQDGKGSEYGGEILITAAE
ncbi:MAG: gliding motility-associated C-terminal domain-containing protein, partial [Flavobacteriales bacterium]|nr:gliding motility-associated C-terminal domain-containing protein [Flavobacteriales bacterium]